MAAALLAWSSGSASAGTAVYTSRSAWGSGLGPVTTFGFDDLPAGTEVGAATYPGVAFSRFNGGVPIVAAESHPQSPPHLLSIDADGGSAAGGVQLDFSAPVQAIGVSYLDAQFPGSFVEVFNAKRERLARFELVWPHPTEWQFVGFRSDTADIARLTVSISGVGPDQIPDRVPLDDVVIGTVPEPSSALLTGAGALALTGLRRRRR